MKLLEKILFATDFSNNAEDALQVAIMVAKTFNSEINLIYVIPEIQDFPDILDIVKEAATKRLQEIQNKITEQGIQIGQISVNVGSPFDQIIQEADRLNVNVIMIGFKGMAAGDKYKLGITAERIIRKANKPVWIVKEREVQPIKKILCPVDFSLPSRRALKNAIHLARNFQAELTVVTVVQPLSSLFPLTRAYDETQETYMKKQQTRFDYFLKRFNFHSVKWNKMIREGKPSADILNIAREKSIELLIMGTSGRTGLARILMGSVTEKVVREMPCSVITVKSEHAIRLKLETEIADIKTHFKRGKDLLEKGFPEEAEHQFRHCLAKDMLFAPAWEGLAAVQEQLRNEAEAKRYTAKATEIRDRLWEQRVTAEIRSYHWLFGKR